LATPDERARAFAAHRGLARFFRAELAHRLKRPRDDLISRLAQAMRDDNGLSEDEAVSLCVNLLVAGHITTSDLIGILTHLLLIHPSERQKLERDGALWPQAVEEALRFEPPTPMLARVHASPGERCGRGFEAGDSINVFIAAANRDPRLFERGDAFDISREDSPHLAFGGGVHYCLGAQLARAEAEIGCRLLFERFPRMALAADGAQWRRTSNFRGLARLQVTTPQPPERPPARRQRAASEFAP
jgi:cytochrome P450